MTVTRRLAVLQLLFLFLPVPVAVQCFRMQVIQGKEWRTRAEYTRRRIEFLEPARGSIVARQPGGADVPLAVETAVHAIYARLSQVDPYVRAVDAVTSACRLPRTAALEALTRRDAGDPVLVFNPPAGARPDKLRRLLRRVTGARVVDLPGGGCRVELASDLAWVRDHTIAELGRVLGVDPALLRNRLAARARQAVGEENSYQRAHDLDTPVRLVAGIEFDAVVVIDESPGLYPGVEVRADTVRRYLLGRTAAHVLGYTGLVNKAEASRLKQDGLLLEFRSGLKELERFRDIRVQARFMSDRVGRMGLEAAYEAELAGAYGARIVERDAAGRERGTLFCDPPVQGRDLVLTIDLAAQAAAQDALGRVCEDMDQRWSGDPARAPEGGVGASVVVLDVTTGAVVVMASYPDYDPAQPVVAGAVGVSSLNRCVRLTYPPGSVFKPITAVAALNAGVVHPSETVLCEGRYPKVQSGFTCKNHGVGLSLDLPGALMRSCNVYFYEMGDRLGGGLLAEYARRMGLGVPTGVDLAGEKGGNLPDPVWKRQSSGESWQPGDSWNLGIGQGALLVTPIQMARAYAMLANGGRLVTPHLVDGMDLPSGEPVVRVPAEVLEGLRWVVEEPGGTAYSVSALRRLEVAGKTGTAQAGGGRYHAWFAGFAPHESPRYALAVCVENVPKGLAGGQVAGPVAAEVFAALLDGANPR